MKAVLRYRAGPGFRARIAAEKPDRPDVAVVDETDAESLAGEPLVHGVA